MSETMTVPDGYTLLRAEDYSALQEIAGPAQAWAFAEAALKAHEAKCPDEFTYSGDWSAAYRRWNQARTPLAEREHATRKALLAAARSSAPLPP